MREKIRKRQYVMTLHAEEKLTEISYISIEKILLPCLGLYCHFQDNDGCLDIFLNVNSCLLFLKGWLSYL
jgi:hypothetical protein